MKTPMVNFNTIVETLYALPLDDKMEIIQLLEHNIAEARRDEIASNYKKAQEELESNSLKFSSQISELKKML
jgi:hypothetical protein